MSVSTCILTVCILVLIQPIVSSSTRRSGIYIPASRSILTEEVGERSEEEQTKPIQQNKDVEEASTQKEPKQENIQQYTLWTPKAISDTLSKWSTHYSDFIKVSTSQEQYGLPTSGGKDDCPFSEDIEGCYTYIYTIQDFFAHPEGSESSNRLPEVFWSGEVHGNEQVGPTAVLEASQLLLDSVQCEALPRPSTLKSNNKEEMQNEIKRALDCRQDLYNRGIDDNHRKWLARLVSTRRLVVVPTANALGYYRRVREEGDIDPNRDFPYEISDPTQCMQTIAARTINEAYREHMFQIALTFHGGMEVIAYEWGAPYWSESSSPDDFAQIAIAEAYSQFAGAFKETSPYAYGSMNDLVYPVQGGMEDWAYAGSFDPERVIQCEPTTYGGYPKEKTVYTNSTLRAFNMLVETSNNKIPPIELLGTSLDIMNPKSSGNGHVARNMRLALLGLDIVEPYVSIKGVANVVLTDDIIPMVFTSVNSCRETKIVTVPTTSSNTVQVKWTVGGVLEVNDVGLWYAKWDDVSINCEEQPSVVTIQSTMQAGTIIGTKTGTGQFSKSGQSDPFVGTIDISSFKPGDEIVVVAHAVADQSWALRSDDAKPSILPQSHVVNARTNPIWLHQFEQKTIQGRLEWFSLPMTIVIGNEEDKVLEISSRNIAIDSNGTTLPSLSTGKPGNDKLSWLSTLLLFSGISVVAYFAFQVYLKQRMRHSHRERVRDFIEDPDAISPGLKEKGLTTRSKGYSDGVELGDLT
jgi:Zinc carboxypeptidase